MADIGQALPPYDTQMPGPHAPNTLMDRWRDWRARLLQNPQFVRWATRFPLTRPIARRKTKETFELLTGFVYTQILTACVELQLLEQLRVESRTIDDIAAQIGLDVDSTRLLVRAAQSLRLVEPRSRGRFGLGEVGATIVGDPGILAMIAHHQVLYRDLVDPIGLLKDREKPTELSRYWAYVHANQPADVRSTEADHYSALMAASQSFIAEVVLDAYPLDRHTHLLDVGGGQGRFASAVLERHSRMKVTVFDLPKVVERAQAWLSDQGHDGRFQTHGGSFFDNDFPIGADVVSLVRVLHDHDDAAAVEILRRSREPLQKGQVLLVAEPMAGSAGAERAGYAYFGFYLLAMRSGRPRSASEITELLERTGFGAVREAPTANPLLTRVLVAKAI